MVPTSFDARPRRHVLALAAALALFAPSLAAQVNAGTPDTVASIVVTATRSTTTVNQMALHTTVITRKEIEASPARTLDQLLRDVPGMNMVGAPYYTTDPTGHQTKMRGATNSKVLMLVDGIPVHDPFFATTQWFKIPLSNVERVEVLRGGSSSLWGSLAVVGVVNIITRKPADDSARLDLGYQSLDTRVASLSKNFLVGPTLALRLSGDLLATDGYQTTPAASLGSFPGKGPSGAHNGNAQLAAYYTPASGALTAFARVGYHRQNEAIGNYRYGNNIQTSPDFAAGVTRFFTGAVRLDARLWGQWEQFDKENGAGCFLASPSSCNTTSTASPLVQYANSRDWNPYRELGASAVVSTPLGTLPVSLQAGMDFRRIAGEDTATTYNKPTTTDGAAATVNRVVYGQGAQRFVGAFAQFHVFPAARLETTVNLRYDWWTNFNGVSQMTRYDSSGPGPTTGGAIPNSSKGSFNPSLSVRYGLTGALSVRGAVYTSFRAPGLNNLYRSYSSSTSITIANPRLSPETLTGGEVGADVDAGRVALGATAFQYSTRNLIASYKVQDSTTAPPDVIAVCGSSLGNCPANINFNTNGQNALSQGVELTASWRAARPVTVDASFTYTDSHYTSTTTGDPTGRQLGAIPANVGILGLSWTPSGRLSAGVTLRYNGDMYLDVNHTIFQPGFTLVGLSASYGLSDRLTVYGTAANLTGVSYADNATTSVSSETLGLPRSITGGMRWTL